MDPRHDPSHWLYRLGANEWLRAADTELGHAEVALARRALRPAVTHARRAAGMALNALLVLEPRPDPRWGRSYMEHVVALARPQGNVDVDVDPDVAGQAADSGPHSIPPSIRQAARDLTAAPLSSPPLVKLGAPDRRPLDAAAEIVAWARARIPAPGAG